MKVLIKEKKNSLVCIAIGKKIYTHWKKFIFPSWEAYCKKNNLGLIVFKEELISKNNPEWKKPTWQRLLVGKKIKDNFPIIKNVCVMDIDIIINPTAPNIFDSINKDKINLTSLRNFIPFEYKSTIRKLAFFRKKFTNKNYPLDSFLNCDLKTLYQTDGLKPQRDELCVGVMAFNLKKFSQILYDWFFYFKKEKLVTNFGGCQNQVAFKILSNNYCNLLNYKFQAIWVFEIAARFPLILKKLKNFEILSDFAFSVLIDNYFLHFAGGGPECKIWLKANFLKRINYKILKEFDLYYQKKLMGSKLFK